MKPERRPRGHFDFAQRIVCVNYIYRAQLIEVQAMCDASCAFSISGCR